jgi:hypothetical protein
VFIGRWKTEGRQHETALGAAAKISALETYEWLTGGRFIVHRFEGHVGDAEAACIEIIGHEESSDRYAVQTFYNNGTTKRWRAQEREGLWVLTGDWQAGGRSQKVRCTITLLDSATVMKGKWQYSNDGSKWHTFWDVTATKVN